MDDVPRLRALLARAATVPAAESTGSGRKAMPP